MQKSKIYLAWCLICIVSTLCFSKYYWGTFSLADPKPIYNPWSGVSGLHTTGVTVKFEKSGYLVSINPNDKTTLPTFVTYPALKSRIVGLLESDLEEAKDLKNRDLSGSLAIGLDSQDQKFIYMTLYDFQSKSIATAIQALWLSKDLESTGLLQGNFKFDIYDRDGAEERSQKIQNLKERLVASFNSRNAFKLSLIFLAYSIYFCPFRIGSIGETSVYYLRFNIYVCDGHDYGQTKLEDVFLPLGKSTGFKYSRLVINKYYGSILNIAEIAKTPYFKWSFGNVLKAYIIPPFALYDALR
ncbi:MAG: hypothetical protein NT027_05390 [Proteobacteria bacterium]|nr:hypothetical protein [Pseudomonadota bacterium]